jgi:hypothetical protein
LFLSNNMRLHAPNQKKLPVAHCRCVCRSVPPAPRVLAFLIGWPPQRIPGHSKFG